MTLPLILITMTGQIKRYFRTMVFTGSISLFLTASLTGCKSKTETAKVDTAANELTKEEIPFITTPKTDQPNNIRLYLMNEAKAITDASLSGINSLGDWESEKSQRYEEFIYSLGLTDVPLNGERSDLNVVITGTVQMEGYRIEKLYFESLPSLYVPANLYIPDNISEPRPAVLYLCGHSSGQKVAYQSYGHKFAELGFVCMIVETVHQGEVTGEHHGCYSRGWYNWYSRGYTPAGVEVWNAVRALDLLSSRNEVDPERLGVTGGSGGGAQTWFVAAVDDRVKAAAPYVGATTMNEQILTKTVDDHCDCMMPINFYKWDFMDIGALIAPRHLLIGQGNRDRLNTVEGVREVYNGIKKVYEYYSVPDNVTLFEYDGGHGSTLVARQKLCSFFLDKLMGKQVPPEETGNIPEVRLSAEELKVYVNGVPADDKTQIIQDHFFQLPGLPEIKNETDLSSHKDKVLKYLKHYTFGAFPEDPVPMNPHMVFRSVDKDKFGSNVYSFVSEQGWRLRVDFRRKLDPAEKNPLLIVLRNRGDKFKESEAFAGRLEGLWNVAYFDVRGVGDAGWEEGLQWHLRRATAWTGRTIAGMQVYDLLRCIEFCRSLDDVNPDMISITAREEMGVVALYSALLDDNIHSVILSNPPATQDQSGSPDGKGAAIEMLNCLRITDIWQIPALLSETQFIFTGQAPETYKWSDDVRKSLSREGLSYIN